VQPKWDTLTPVVCHKNYKTDLKKFKDPNLIPFKKFKTILEPVVCKLRNG